MSLTVRHAFKTSYRKLMRKRLRTFFTVFPIAFMTLVIFVVTTILGSLNMIVTEKVVDKANERLQIIRVHGQDLENADLSIPVAAPLLSEIEHVQDVYQVRELPIERIKSQDLDTLGEASLRLGLLPAEAAAQYTDLDFSYSPDKPIPIVIGRTSTVVSSTDWGGETEVVVDYTTDDTAPVSLLATQMQVSELIGKRFSAGIGGFEAIQDYTVEQVDTRLSFEEIYKKRSQEDINTSSTGRSETINTYWEYDTIKDGFSQEFIVVGIDDNIASTMSMIPVDAGLALAQKLHQIEQDARRVAVPLPENSLGDETALFAGTRIEAGVIPSLNDDPTYFGIFDPAQEPLGYAVPGLYFTDIDGVAKETSIALTEDVLLPNQLLVTIDDPENREAVIGNIQDVGIFVTDDSLSALFKSFTGLFYWVLAVITGIMFAINVVIILLTLGKSVSESRREIGVWRALGATKQDVLKLFLSQSVIVMGAGFMGGIIGGWLIVLWLAGSLASGINTILEDIVGVLISQPVNVSSVDFLLPDFRVFGLYIAALMGIVVLLSLIPSRRAANISPIEAIRKAD